MSALLAAIGGSLLSQLNSWDTSALLLLNGLHSPFWDSILCEVSSPWVLVPVHLLVLFAVLRQPNWRERGALLGLLALVILVDLAGAHFIKDLVQRPRPPQQAELAPLVHLLGGRRSGTYGFVSTHTAYAFALAAFVLLHLRRPWLTSALFAWAFAVGYSRIYIGLHFPGDILGGAMWGTAVAIAVWWASQRAWSLAIPRARLAAALGGEIAAGMPRARAKVAPPAHASHSATTF